MNSKANDLVTRYQREGRNAIPMTTETEIITYTPPLTWTRPLTPSGPEDKPESRLLGIVEIGGVSFHADAWQVRQTDDNELETVAEYGSEELDLIYQIVSGSIQTIHFGDREYVLSITPFES